MQIKHLSITAEYPNRAAAILAELTDGSAYPFPSKTKDTAQSLDHLKVVAEKHELHHRFRPRLGGPLYEIWLESQILVEFVSDEIRNLKS